MYDKELAIEILKQIRKAAGTLVQRFQPVKTINDFTDSARGQEKLDSICMLLIVIGETLKKLDKVTDGKLLCKYPGIDWKRAKGLRDIISHQYFDVNAEAIFNVCETKIKPLLETISTILDDLS